MHSPVSAIDELTTERASGPETASQAAKVPDSRPVCHLSIVFTHCLSCQIRFPEPDTLDGPIRGDRIAYDPERGRLWSICRNCGSWGLAPIEERWEILEELEGLTTRSGGAGRARLLSRTDNIELFELGPLRIVRIGKSNRLEEAWWRYGQRLQQAWHHEKRITVGGAATAGAAIIGGVLGAALPTRYGFRRPSDVRRWLRFGDHAWSGHARCALCGHSFDALAFFDRTIVQLYEQEGEGTGLGLSRRCPSCKDAHTGGLHLKGMEAEHTLRRLLAYENHPSVPEPRIRTALSLIDREGGPSRLVRVLMRHTNQLGDLPPSAVVALEVATNEAREQRLMRLEVAALEAYWREAEVLASIVDGELTPISGVERLRVKAAERH